MISTGSIADADATFTVLLEESNDSGMSGATAVDDADLLGTETLAGFQFDDDNETRKIGYIGKKRYSRMTKRQLSTLLLLCFPWLLSLAIRQCANNKSISY